MNGRNSVIDVAGSTVEIRRRIFCCVSLLAGLRRKVTKIVKPRRAASTRDAACVSVVRYNGDDIPIRRACTRTPRSARASSPETC